MARQKSYEDQEPAKTLTRVESFRATKQSETINSPTATEPTSKSKLTKDLTQNYNGNSTQPKKSMYQIKKELGELHEKLSDELFDVQNKERDGLRIFEDYDSRDGKILSSLSMDDASVFHKILNCIENLIKYGEATELMHTVPAVAREFLECLVIKHHDLLTKPNEKGFRPLDTAALKVKPVVFLIADLVFSEDKIRELPVRACPARVKVRPTDVCHLELPKSIRYIFARSKGSAIPSVSTASTCLHDTVDVDELGRWSSQLKSTVTSVLKPRSIGGASANAGTILHALLEEECFAREGSRIKAASFQRLIELCDKETLLSTDAKGHCPLHKAVQLYRAKGIDFERLHDVIHSLVQRYPAAIYEGINIITKKTPYSTLNDINRSQENENVCKTLKLLKHTCIGADRLDRGGKLIHLYGNLKNAKDIRLDMTFPKIIDRDLIDYVSSVVKFRFDTALEYVSLRRDESNPDPSSPQKRNPYQGVFEWLKSEWKVEKIFSVIVDDLVRYPHTDESIKTALKPFKVEKWDWRKLDMSSQTIIDAAPDVRELCLHSSGNEAVLRSWSCKHGLPKLLKLESITVTMHPDLRETKETCAKYFQSFEEAFCRRRKEMKGNIRLEWAGELSSQGSDSGGIGSSSEPYQTGEDAWVQTMKPFIEFLESVKNKIDEERSDEPVGVSIALIDNGVLCTAEGIPIQTHGFSWHGQRSKGLFRDFYTGPSLHGTRMAQCIYKVCPMVQLYVARMDDSSKLERFTVDSAIKAIQWAIDMDVDIISMSWSFPINDATNEQKRDFKEVIQKASNLGIILFGSLNDKEMTSHTDWYPIGISDVIRVGSATKWGEKAEPNRAKAANYLFPGQEITLRTGTDADGIHSSEGKGEVASGSSLATAFAAGLAGLIIYASRAYLCLDKDLGEGEKKLLEAIATRENIEGAFKTLGGKPYEYTAADLFVELGSHFPKDPCKDAEEQRNTGVLKKFLTKLVL